MAMMDLFTMAGQIVTNADDANKDIDSVTNKAEESEGRMVKAFKGIGAAVIAAFAVDKIIGFGKTMVETSAKLQALDSQFDQTFKDNQGQAMELINKQVEDQGIHVDRLRGAWSSFYGTFKGNGADANQSLDLTSKYMTLAGDASAYYDTSLEDVVGRLKSITMGNFEAGDAIGININATKMDTIAKQQYNKAWQNLSDTEKEYLLIDTVGKIYENNGAMGQGAREANGYENVMGNLNASWDRFLKVIGSPFLGGAIVVVQGITNAVTGLTESIQEHPVLFGTIAAVVGVLTAGIITYTISMNAAAISTFLMTTATTAFGAAMAFVTSPIGIVTLVMAGLIAAGVALYQNWDFIKAKATEIWGSISSFVSERLNAMGIDTTSFSSVVNSVFNKLFDIMTTPYRKAYEFIMGITDKIKDSINNLFGTNIKLPHFKLDGEFSLMPPRVPKLGVEWYADGGIMTKPGIFGVNPSTGKLMAGGESSTGGEAIMPLNKLPEIMAEAMRRVGFGNQVVQVVLPDGRILAELVAENQNIIDRYQSRDVGGNLAW
ncbi:hypothetical protein [Clostridium sp. YIM B02506]|uniref:hypothetical protein n=1 Tax=Clostridium sp. YIM B02506 TaxID=2910680 RepID=UPI001EECFEAB|nr:hypothetical protein [Clostridium sp. YIM B02506]